jgi:hypothetical protein
LLNGCLHGLLFLKLFELNGEIALHVQKCIAGYKITIGKKIITAPVVRKVIFRCL